MEHKVITISQQKGGAGKTTVAAHLAIGFMQKGYKVATLDVDPQGSLSAWYNAREVSLGAENTGLYCDVMTDNWGLDYEIDKLQEEYDIVIIDCPPHTKDNAQKAVRKADLVLIPIQPSPTDLWATTNTVLLTNQENAHTYLLLNRVVQNSNLAKRFIKDLPRSRLKAVLGNRISFPTAMSEGLCVTETQPSSKAAKEVQSVLKEVISILKAQDKELRKTA